MLYMPMYIRLIFHIQHVIFAYVESL